MNSARYNKNVNTIASNGHSKQDQTLNFLFGLQERVREYIEIKVRLRDPLDDNAAHLIPSSRIVTARQVMGVMAAAGGGPSLNRC
jgi:hypothetical protein